MTGRNWEYLERQWNCKESDSKYWTVCRNNEIRAPHNEFQVLSLASLPWSAVQCNSHAPQWFFHCFFSKAGPMLSSGITQKGTPMFLALKLLRSEGRGEKEKGSGPDQTQWTQLQNDMAQNKGGIVHLPYMNEGWAMNRGGNKKRIIASKNYPLIKEIFSVGL